MVGRGQEELVQLHRDTVSTSWGFRLQGGQEANTPLTVQRVFVGGVADGKLHRGDVIVSIGGQNARGMFHSQAEEIIKSVGRDISFKVLRGGGGGGGESHATNDFNSHQAPWQQPSAAPSWGQPSAAPSWSQPSAAPSWPVAPSSLPDEDYEQQRSFGDLKRQFQNPAEAGRIQNNPQIGKPSYIPKRPVIIKKSGHFEAGLSDPGWVPGSSSSHQSAPKASRYVPHSPPVNSSSSRQQHPHYATIPRFSSEPVRHEPAETPAWLGTLRSAGGPRLWEIKEGESIVGGGARVPAPAKQDLGSQTVYASSAPVARGPPVHSPRVQAARYGPGGAAPTYDQYSAEGVDSESARVAHLQYNTPIGLYSRDSAREALEGQTRGKAGYGTMEITGAGRNGPPGGKIKPFDPAHSDVYRLVLEEDEVKKTGGRPRGHGRADAQPRPAQQQQQAPTAAEEAAHSSRFYQLVHENDDQTDQYSRVHPGHYQHPEPGVAAMRDVGGGGGAQSHYDDTGVSDF